MTSFTMLNANLRNKRNGKMKITSSMITFWCENERNEKNPFRRHKRDQTCGNDTGTLFSRYFFRDT